MDGCEMRSEWKAVRRSGGMTLRRDLCRWIAVKRDLDGKLKEEMLRDVYED
jgi:hypothetical protein